jgi:glycosyltransferase involved in cell wall biosynthesis
MPDEDIKYSICICNRNMADTLRESLSSVLEQIGNNFEVIVVDDGSTDSSKEILQELSSKFHALRVFYLEKDKNRRLGKTRNISFLKARGQWCIFHIDTDDLIGPHIVDFVKVIEALNSRINKDCLFSGKQIHMAKRGFLIANGPFKNIYRGEDRDLYQRLALSNRWVTILHERFIYRIERKKKKLKSKAIRDAWDQMVTDMQMSPILYKYLKGSLIKIKQIGLTLILFRFMFAIPARLVAQRRGIFLNYDRINNYAQFAKYREENTKTLSEWQSILGIDDDKLIGINREIFY